jgi:low temperature requirement protein LtrA
MNMWESISWNMIETICLECIHSCSMCNITHIFKKRTSINKATKLHRKKKKQFTLLYEHLSIYLAIWQLPCLGLEFGLGLGFVHDTSRIQIHQHRVGRLFVLLCVFFLLSVRVCLCVFVCTYQKTHHCVQLVHTTT